MLDLDAILAKVTDPNVTEEQLQQILQQVTTGFTEVNVALKISKEELQKSFTEGHPLQEDIMKLIQTEDASESKLLTEHIISKLDTNIKASIDKLNNLLQDAATDPILQQESATVQQLISLLQTNADSTQLNNVLTTVQSKLSANQSGLAVQQNRLDQMLANASLNISEETKAKLESATGEERIAIYKEMITLFETQIQENIASYRAYQQTTQGENGVN